MLNTNEISIDGDGNISLQNVYGSTINIGKGDDAEAIAAKLQQLQEAQLDALQQIVAKQSADFSHELKEALKGLVTQKNIVSGSISDVGGNVNVGDNITYIIQTHSGIGDNIAGKKINRQINMGAGSTYIENNGNASKRDEPTKKEEETRSKPMYSNSNVPKQPETPSGILAMLLGWLPRPFRMITAIAILSLVGYVGYHYFMPKEDEAQKTETSTVVITPEKVYVSGIIHINNGEPKPNEIRRMTLRNIDANSASIDAIGRFTFTDVKIPANKRLLVDVTFFDGKTVPTEELIVGEADSDTKTVRLPDLYATRPQPARNGRPATGWKIQVNVNMGSGDFNAVQK